MRRTDWMALGFAAGAVPLLLVVTSPSASVPRLSAQSPVRHVIELTPEADTCYERNVFTSAPVNATPQGSSDELQAGWSDVGIDEYAVIRFAVPTTLPEHVVDSAELELGVVHAAILTFRPPSPVSGTMRLSLGPVAEPWDEATLTSLAPPLIGAPTIWADVEWGPCARDDCGTARVAVTRFVRGWMEETWGNFGLVMHAHGVYDPIMGTIYSVASRESNRPPILRIVEVGEDEVTPTLPPPTPTTAPTSLPSRPVWVPLALRYPIVLPTVTPSPGPSETSTCTPTPGTGPYLLVERWEHEERGPGCGLMLIDFPTYRFFPESGILRLYPFHSWNPALETTDLGYYGSGWSVEGERSGGEDSGLERIVTLPFDADDIQIRSVDDVGAVVVAHGGEDIPLSTGSERHWHWVGPGRREAPGCVIATTLRVTNYGYQDRAKIVYDN